MKKIKIGFLPLYVKMYDEYIQYIRPEMQKFYDKVSDILGKQGFDVVRTFFCRTEEEFCGAIESYEQDGIDVIVTMHMAYSPSGMCRKALVNTDIPIVIFDSTPDYEFGQEWQSKNIDFNHGIHGVMDMCNIIHRNGKKYAIAAGNIEHSDVTHRVCELIKAAAASRKLSGSTTAIYGDEFEGMDDFNVSKEILKKRFGINVVQMPPDELEKYSDDISDQEIAEETAKDKDDFIIPDELDKNRYKESIRSGLALRKWLNDNKIDAFSLNFLSFNAEIGLENIPYTEVCKSMKRGIGYAGEGDRLTSSFTGAFMKAFDKISFIEIFCPDWKNNTLLLSHMGEVNYAVTTKPVLLEMGFDYTTAGNPIYGAAKLLPGKAVYVNISPDNNDFTLIASEVEMTTYEHDNMDNDIHGFMHVNMPTSDFLEKISTNGATHHSILIYDTTVQAIEYFGNLLGIKTVII